MICAICGHEIEGFAHDWRPGQVICFDCRVEHDPALVRLRYLGDADPLVALQNMVHPPEYWRQLDQDRSREGNNGA